MTNDNDYTNNGSAVLPYCLAFLTAVCIFFIWKDDGPDLNQKIQELEVQNQSLEFELYVVLEQRAQLWDALDKIRSISHDDPSNAVAQPFGEIAQNAMLNVDLLNKDEVNR